MTRLKMKLKLFPDKYKDVKSSIMYKRDNLTFDLVFSNLISKDLEIKVSDKNSVNNGLFVRGKRNKREKCSNKTLSIGQSLGLKSI